MKKPRISLIWGVVMFVLIAAAYAMGYLFYEEYTQQMAYIAAQNQSAIKHQAALQDSLRKLEVALTDLQTASRRDRKDILAKIDTINAAIRKQQDEYNATLTRIQDEYNTSLDQVKADIITNLERVDLGKISVEKTLPE